MARSSVVFSYCLSFFFVSIGRSVRGCSCDNDFAVLKDELDQLKENLRQLSQENAEHRKEQQIRILELKSAVTKNELENKELKKSFETLYNRQFQDEQQRVNKTKRQHVTGYKLFLTKSGSGLLSSKSNIRKQQKDSVQILSKKVLFGRRETGTDVAFFAQLDIPLSNLRDNQDIPFDRVITDTHNSFNGPTGVFTCPESGLYVFIVSLLSYPGTKTEATVKVNGNKYIFVSAEGPKHEISYNQGTSAGVLRLNAGDKVWVSVHGTGHSGAGEMLFSGYSSFMGFKI